MCEFGQFFMLNDCCNNMVYVESYIFQNHHNYNNKPYYIICKKCAKTFKDAITELSEKEYKSKLKSLILL